MNRCVFLCLIVLLALAGCQTLGGNDRTLYEDLGGKEKIEEFVDRFIEQIGYNPLIIHQFENIDLEQFRRNSIAHTCHIADGPCEYNGRHMKEAHDGLNVTEEEFNSSTDSMIEAMKQTGWSVDLRNRLLERLSKFRDEVLYQ